MESGDTSKKRKVKQDVPPVPIKTYKWEDVKRAKQKGGYPWTYLTKGPLEDDDIMDEGKGTQPTHVETKETEETKEKTETKEDTTETGEEKKPKKKVVKKKIVKKVIKKVPKVDELDQKQDQDEKKLDSESTEIPESSKPPNIPSEIKSSDDKKVEVEEIKTQEKTEPELPLPREEIKIELDVKKPEDEAISVDDWLGSSDTPEVTVSLKLKSTKKLENEAIPVDGWLGSTEEKKIDVISQDTPIEQKVKVEDTSKETIDKKVEETIQTKDIKPEKIEEKSTLLVDDGEKISQKAQSITGSDESNVEQYLDKEELSKASTTDISTLHDKPEETKLAEASSSKEDKKRKFSSTSEITKSTLSLFQKMKNSKFKPPTFKVPKFKKFGFSKKPKLESRQSSLKKEEPKVSPSTKRKSDTPVYIYIPLNPSPEQLAKEKEEELKKQMKILVAEKKTKIVTPVEVRKSESVKPGGIQSFTSRWKNIQKSTGKKSPPVKKKSLKSVLKTSKRKSPSPPKKSSPVPEKKGDSPPVEYIHIPLKSPEEEQKVEEDEKPALTRKYMKDQEKIKENKTLKETVGKPLKSSFKKKIVIKPLADEKSKSGKKTPPRKMSPSAKKRLSSSREDIRIAISEIEIPKPEEKPVEKQEETVVDAPAETPVEEKLDASVESPMEEKITSKEEKKEEKVEEESKEEKEKEEVKKEDEVKDISNEKETDKKPQTKAKGEKISFSIFKKKAKTSPKASKKTNGRKSPPKRASPPKRTSPSKKEGSPKYIHIPLKDPDSAAKDSAEVENAEEVKEEELTALGTETKHEEEAVKLESPARHEDEALSIEEWLGSAETPSEEPSGTIETKKEKEVEKTDDKEEKPEKKKPTLERQKSIFKETGDKLKETGEKIKETSVKLSKETGEKLKQTGEKIKETSVKLSKETGEKLKEAGEKIKETGGKIKESSAKFSKETGEKVKEKSAKVSKDIKDLATKVKDTTLTAPAAFKKSMKIKEKKDAPAETEKEEEHKIEGDTKETELEKKEEITDETKGDQTKADETKETETTQAETKESGDLDDGGWKVDEAEEEQKVEETTVPTEVTEQVIVKETEKKKALPPLPKKKPKREKKKKKAPSESKFKARTQQFSDDIKILASKFKTLQKREAKKPTSKLFRKGQRASFRSISSQASKSSKRSTGTRSRSRSARISTCSSGKESPVTAAESEGPTDVNVALQEAARKLQRLTSKPGDVPETPVQQEVLTFDEVWKEEVDEAIAQEKEKHKKDHSTHSPFDSLKKTKEKTREFSRKSIKRLKDAMKPKDKEKKVAINTDAAVKEITPDVQRKEGPEYIVIPLKDEETEKTEEEASSEHRPKTDEGEKETKSEKIDEPLVKNDEDMPHEEAKEISETETQKTEVVQLPTEAEEKKEPETEEPKKVEKMPRVKKLIKKKSMEKAEKEKKAEEKEIIKPKEKPPLAPKPTTDKIETKEELTQKQEEVHHYEPISKEDEEDGLKTAVIKSKKEKAPDIPPKSSIKFKDSPKLDKKVSFMEKSQPRETEDLQNGLQPEKTVEVQEKVASETDKIATSLPDDHNRWSNLSDHEYEPINPPPEPVQVPTYTAPPTADVSKQTAADEQHSQNDVFNADRRLRIPLDNELIVASADDADAHKKLDSHQREPSPDKDAAQQKLATSAADAAKDLDIAQPESTTQGEKKSKKSKKKEKMAPQEDQGPTMQQKLRNQADVLKTKFKSIKKPTFTVPSKLKRPSFQRPQFQRPKINVPKINRPKFERPKFDTSKIKMPKMPNMPKMPQMKSMPKMQMPTMPKMPKMPERPHINFPSFSLPRTKRQQGDRTLTTESSLDSKPNIFDFRTYPRIFDRSKKAKMTEAEEVASSGTDNPPLEVATVPRRKKGPVGARWVKKFSDIHYADAELKAADATAVTSRDDDEDVLRFEEDLEAEELREYERENQDIHRKAEINERWSHGSFHHTAPLDGDEEMKPGFEAETNKRREFDDNQQSERSSVGSSGSRRRRGVLEEIDSDEFFLRQKGISQDNIQVGLYLSSEIRDAFRQPVNTLSQMSDMPQRYDSREYEMDGSDLSLTKPRRPKRKQLKKTKKIRRTPHASHEKVTYDRESVNTEPEEYPRKPAIPKRAKRSKPADDEQIQEQEPVQEKIQKTQAPMARHESDNLSLPNIIGYVDKDINKEYERYLKDEALMYENEVMEGKEQPEIVVMGGQENGFREFDQKEIDKFLEESGMMDTPKPPTRRHRSLRSLDISEHDSIIGEFNRDKILPNIPAQEVSVYRVQHEYVTPTLEDSPLPPKRTRSRSRTSEPDDGATSRDAESISSEVQEPRCVLDLRDEMGYAIVDKSRSREPPTPRRRSLKEKKSPNMETKFFTTPRPLNDTLPTRPSRNYSTLGPSRPPRRKSPATPHDEEENKENIDIGQYIEIEDDMDDDHSRDLQSGEVINKMKGRPLPAPPRPPRKGRDRSKDSLRDITQDENIMRDSEEMQKEALDIPPTSRMEAVEEIEVSTQTDPLPDDFVCEEVLQEPTDRVVAPRRRRRSTLDSTPDQTPKTPDRPKTPLDGTTSPNVMIIEKRVQTPTVFDGDTTVTHASIVVKPVAEYPPDSYVSKRFSADLPEDLVIMPEILSSPITYPSEEPEEPEASDAPEAPETEPVLKSIPTSDTLDKDMQADFALQKESVPPLTSEIIDHEAEFRKNMLESIDDDLVCDIVSESVEETPPEIPEKPLRMRLRQQESEVESKPEVPPAPQIPPQPQIIERIIERPVPFSVTPGPDTEVEVLKAARLQVADLDVERLNVTELQAQKILVSEIDGVNLQIAELSSKTGSIIINGLEIPSGLIQELLEKLQPAPQAPPVSSQQVETQTEEQEESSTTELPVQEEKTEVKETPIPEHQKVMKLTTEVIDISESPLSFQQYDPPTEVKKPEETKVEESASLEKKKREYILDQPKDIEVSIDEKKEEPIKVVEDLLIKTQDTTIHTQEEPVKIEESLEIEEEPFRLTEDPIKVEESFRIEAEPIKTVELPKEETDDLLTHQISDLQKEIASLQEQMALDSMLDSEEEVIPDKPHEVDDLTAEAPAKDVVTESKQEESKVLESKEKDKTEPEVSEEHGVERTEDTEKTEECKKSDLKSMAEESIKPAEFHELKPEAVTTEESVKSVVEEESIKPVEFSELKSEPVDSKESKTQDTTKTEEDKESKPTETEDAELKKKTDSTKATLESPEKQHIPQPVAPSEVPPQNVLGSLGTSQVLQGIPYPVSYYPELVHSVADSSFCTFHLPQSHDLSEEDIPVHHRRRKPHRRMSRSSSEEEPRTISRRHTTRSPEPTVSQLTGQLARQSALSLNRIVRQLMSYVSTNVVGTPEGKQDLQIALIIILVLIAGLILLGFGGGKTVHHHHWEYFNPPTD